MMKFINPLNNTGKFRIKMTQSFIDGRKVDEIKKNMISGNFNFKSESNKIGYEVFDKTFYITEGHHRMQAALEIWKKSGDYSFVESLIKNGLGYHTKSKPISYRFKI